MKQHIKEIDLKIWLRPLLRFEIRVLLWVSSFTLSLEFWFSLWVWSFYFHFEFGVLIFTLNLEFQFSLWIWSFDFHFEFGVRFSLWVWSFRFSLWVSRFEFRFQMQHKQCTACSMGNRFKYSIKWLIRDYCSLQTPVPMYVMSMSWHHIDIMMII